MDISNDNFNGLTEKERKELELLENPDIQYFSPASAFLMKWFYDWQRKRRIEKLRSKIKPKN